MEAAGCPVSELHPLQGAVSLESTFSGQSLFETSKSYPVAITDSRLAGRDYTYQEEPKEALSEMCKKNSATAANLSSQRVRGEPGEQEKSPSKHCVPSHALCHPQSLVETHREIGSNAINRHAGGTVQKIKPTSQPTYMTSSSPFSLVKQGMSPPTLDSEACGLTYHGGDRSMKEAECHSILACKQPMKLQQCDIITTICRGANSGEDGVQQPQSRFICTPTHKAISFEQKGHLPPKCDEAVWRSSYIHDANFEDTFAAYCHPQPIPTPSQVLPHHVESSCNIQCTVAPSLAMNHLTLPRPMSSVSEAGLDAKHLLGCCNLSCSLISLLPPGAGLQSKKQTGLEQCCPLGHVRITTREMGTMTTHKELRDVGVQTGQTITSHVFPQVCLAKESKSETSCSQTLTTDTDEGKRVDGALKSPVKEVKWDAEGMTWEVYGASVDPEELGLAIQRHLELQIRETASHATKLSHQNTNTFQQSGNRGCQRKRSKMMCSIRTPACCARTTTAVD